MTDSPTDACINVGVATGADSSRSRVSGLVCTEVARGSLDAVTGEACARGAAVAEQMAQSVSGAGGMRSVYVASEGDIPARATASNAVASGASGVSGASGRARVGSCYRAVSQCVGDVIGSPAENTTQAAPPPAAAPAEASLTEEEKEKFAAYLMALTRGIAADAGVSVGIVMSVVCDAVQRNKSRKKSGDQLEVQTGVAVVNKATALTVGVITDTGATIKGVGARHDKLLQNVGKLSCPVSVATAVGDTRLEKTGDLAMAGGLSGAMDGSLVLESCADSIMPVVPTCEQLDLGYQTSQLRVERELGSIEMVRRCRCLERRVSSLFTAPVASLIEDDSEWSDCDDGLDIKWGLVVADISVEPERERIDLYFSMNNISTKLTYLSLVY